MNFYTMVTGGGVKFVADLIKYGGVSKFFDGAEIPYATKHLEDRIGKFDKAVSKETCLAMLDYCISKISGVDKFAIACTAKLKTDGEREGREHYAYFGCNHNGVIRIFRIDYHDRRKTRYSQEERLSDCLYNLFSYREKIRLNSLYPEFYGSLITEVT